MALALMMTSGIQAQKVYNANGSNCGKIESNGTVRNDRNQKIGKIESNGTVRNERNQQIGRVSGIPKEWAAAFFFFFFN